MQIKVGLYECHQNRLADIDKTYLARRSCHLPSNTILQKSQLQVERLNHTYHHIRRDLIMTLSPHSTHLVPYHKVPLQRLQQPSSDYLNNSHLAPTHFLFFPQVHHAMHLLFNPHSMGTKPHPLSLVLYSTSPNPQRRALLKRSPQNSPSKTMALQQTMTGSLLQRCRKKGRFPPAVP